MNEPRKPHHFPPEPDCRMCQEWERGLQMQRRYTVQEIDAMRGYVRSLLTWNLQVYSPAEIDRQAEDRLRTYMQNGTTVDELKAELRRVSPQYDSLCREEEERREQRERFKLEHHFETCTDENCEPCNEIAKATAPENGR